MRSGTARLPLTHPEQIRMPPEEALAFDDLKDSVADVADEIAARLIAAFRRATR